MQVTVKQAHNLHECDVEHGFRFGQSHGDEGLEWLVTVNGCTVCTAFHPEDHVTDDAKREDTGLVFGVPENPFPISASLALVKRQGQHKVAQGQVLLTAACFSASGERNMWVPFAAVKKQVGQKRRLLARRQLSVQSLSDASEDEDGKAGCQSPCLRGDGTGPGVWIEVLHRKHLGNAKVTAAAKKLQKEIEDAMADGVITEEEQRQIDANKARLDAVKQAHDDAYIEMGIDSQGELDDAARVEAASKKLQREVQDAMDDGVLTAEEQRQIAAKKAALVAAKKALERGSSRPSSISSPGGVGGGQWEEDPALSNLLMRADCLQQGVGAGYYFIFLFSDSTYQPNETACESLSLYLSLSLSLSLSLCFNFIRKLEAVLFFYFASHKV